MFRKHLKAKNEPSPDSYVVRIIRAWGPSVNSGERFYRVHVRPDNVETMSVATKWVKNEVGGDPVFDQVLTFHHPSSPSTLWVSLEMAARDTKVSGKMSGYVNHETVGTGWFPLPTVVRNPVENNVTIFDKNQEPRGTIEVSFAKTKLEHLSESKTKLQ